MVVPGGRGLMTSIRFRYGSILVILLYGLMALAYGVVNPAFESPDELYHFDYVEELLRSRRLPVVGTELSEFHQPPLYYLAGAVATAWLPPGPPAPQVIARNVYWPWRIGEVGVDNKSQFVHGPEQAFPYTGLWLRLHLVRVLSVFWGAVTVWLTGRLALQLWPGRFAVALLAMAFVAFLPQFLFVSSSVSNDIAATALSAGILVALGRFLVETGEPGQPAHPYRWAAVVGGLLGLAALVKMSLLILWPLVGLVLVLRALVDRPPGQGTLARSYLLLVATALVVAVPYLVRNWSIYGDPTALSQMDAVWGRREPPLAWAETVTRLPNIWTSFWARFGYGQIPVPNALYVAAAGLVLVALVGLVLAWHQHRPLRRQMGLRFWLLVYGVLLSLAFLAAVIRYSQTSFNGDFGRFVFPALPAVAVLLALGWITALGQLGVSRPATAAGLATVMLAFSLWALLAILRPAYVVPGGAASVAADDRGEVGSERYLGDVAVLRRATVLNPLLTPGGDAEVEVELMPLRRTASPLTLFIWLVGPDGQRLGDRHSYPGLGRLSTTFWQPGEPVVDRYKVPVDEALSQGVAPAAVSVFVGLYDRAADEILPVTEGLGGAQVGQPVAEAKLAPQGLEDGAPIGSSPALATFGDSLQLNMADFPALAEPGSTVPVMLDWTVLKPPGCDCKLFVHLVGMDGLDPLAQVDEAILQGRYPSRLWAAGEQLRDRHELAIPASLAPGSYRLVMGLFRDEPGWPRLPVQAGAGDTGESSYVLGQIEVGGTSPGAAGPDRGLRGAWPQEFDKVRPRRYNFVLSTSAGL